MRFFHSYSVEIFLSRFQVRIWDVETGECVKLLTVFTSIFTVFLAWYWILIRKTFISHPSAPMFAYRCAYRMYSPWYCGRDNVGAFTKTRNCLFYLNRFLIQHSKALPLWRCQPVPQVMRVHLSVIWLWKDKSM